MHEFAICQGLLREVERVAAANRARKVVEIHVEIGPLSGVEARQLSSAFGVARLGTIAEGASLTVQAVPVVVWCPSCVAESAAAPNIILCAKCGSWKVDVRSGNELLLRRMKLADVEEDTKVGLAV